MTRMRWCLGHLGQTGASTLKDPRFNVSDRKVDFRVDQTHLTGLGHLSHHLENAACGVFLFDVDDRILYANQEFRSQFLGDSVEQVGSLDQLPSQMRDTYRYAQQQLLGMKRSIIFGFHITGAAGKREWFQASLAPIVSHDNRAVAAISVTFEASADLDDPWQLRELATARTAIDNLHGLKRDAVTTLMRARDGVTNQMIAKELDVSIRTVERHRRAVMRALNVDSTAGMVHAADVLSEFGLLPGDIVDPG